MDDGIGTLIWIAVVIVTVIAVVYVITLIAAAIAMAAAAGGSLWGGGRAIFNYGKSIKENLIDSNRAAAA